MKAFSGFAVSALLVLFGSIGVSAQQEQAGSQSTAPQETAAGEAAKSQGATTDDATAKQVKELREHMQEMQKQMDQIAATDDPQKRNELMQQHRQSMREGMQMMNEMGRAHGQMMSGSGMGMMQGRGRDSCPQSDVQCQRLQSIESRQRTMMDRLDVMQMMMQQMIEYQSDQVIEVEE